VLLVLARSDSALSIAELSERTGYTTSLVYRVLGELEARDYASKRPNGGYSLGLAVVELGGAFTASVPLMSSVRGVLRRLADVTEETASLGILQGDQVLYLMREEGARSVFALSRVGKRLPANAVAIGKALLAEKTDAEIRATFAASLDGDGELAALTPTTITSLDALLDDLAHVRERGHAEEHGEAVRGRCAVAATAAFHQQGIDNVAISISMNEARFDLAHASILENLLEACDRVAREARGRAAIGEPQSPPEVVVGGLS
jgi:DNA-binding IclR family transcriptional regulator